MALQVALNAQGAGDVAPGTFAVHVSVNGGTRPLSLSVYFDGQLLGAWDSLADVYEFRASDVFGARHALTVRAVDAAGQWGGASTILRAGHPPLDGPPPRIALRSSVRSRGA